MPDAFNLITAVLFEQLQFCPLCSATLVLHENPSPIKYCPNACGHGVSGENSDGLPIIVFEVPE